MTYKEKLDKFTFLVPIFSLEGDRLENFKFILDKLIETQANILVIEQVQNKRKKTIPKELCKKLNVNYLSVGINDTHIHKSKLINVGTDYIKTEFVWVNDSDCYLKFREAIELIDFRYNFIQPYKVGKYLEKEDSNRIRNNEKVNVNFRYREYKENPMIVPGVLQHAGMYGALSFIYSKVHFLKIGGMDENYTGWGWEDNDLCMRMFLYDSLKFNVLNIYSIHLYHPRGNLNKQLQVKSSQNNLNTYTKKFNGSHIEIDNRIKNYYTNFFEKNEKISIIGISRSGTTHLATGISSANNLMPYIEFLNEYGLKIINDNKERVENQPFISVLNNNIDLERYIDLIYQNNNICAKHIINDNYGTNVFTENEVELQSTCVQKIIQHSNKILLTTRFNFLDWVTSQSLASHQAKWNYFGGEYTEGITEISEERFNHLYKIWYRYHFDTLPKLKKICDKNNKNYIIVDYEDINNVSILNNKLFKLGINNFIPKFKKQKKKTNDKYIINYDQVKKWYNEKEHIPFYILTRFSLKCKNENNHINEQWLVERLKIFDVCFESINNQTFKQFKWLLLIHPDTLDFAKTKLYEYKDKLPQIEIIELNSNMWGGNNSDNLNIHICNYIEKQNKYIDSEGEFITMWHDSDDFLIDENTILDFFNHLKSKPVSTLARSSIQAKGTDCNISPQILLKRDWPGTVSTCFAVKSSIKSSEICTVFKYPHFLWGEHKPDNINIIDVLPKKPRHYKLIHKNAVQNTPKKQLATESKLSEFINNDLITLYNKLPKSDKGTAHCYIQNYYNDIFMNKNIDNIVEIGVNKGYSINLWSKYFGNKTNVYGIDINLKKIDPSIVFDNNVNLIEDNAVSKDIKNTLPDNIDIIIDDGSHKLEHQINTFRLLFPKLKEGGIYIIEDIQNINNMKDAFLDLPGQVKIYDLRDVKNRYDDVIVEITKVPAFNIIDKQFNIYCNINCCIHEHLPVIAKYSSECDTIVEMGVLNIVSTWAFLKGRPKKLTSIDIKSPPKHRLDLVNQACKSENINFSFIENNTLDVEIDECDLLFIDTFHTYKHLKQELKLHGNKSKKYLIFHDTVTFGRRGQDSSTPGLLAAIDEFIEENPHWIKKKFYNNNHGLGILERVR